MSGEIELRNQLVEMGRRLWQRNLVGATEGNLSCRLGNLGFLCTPSGLSKGHLKADDLVVIDAAGQPLRRGQAPSSEIRLHLHAYASRPDVAAVVHAHPLTATAFALAHRPIPGGLLPEGEVVLGPIALCPFGMPGTDALPATLDPYLADHDTFLLANHGAVTFGLSIEDAYHRMETLERVATIYRDALALGRPVPLPDSAMEPLRNLREELKRPHLNPLG